MAGVWWTHIYRKWLFSDAHYIAWRMIPFSFSAAAFSALSGVLVSRTGQYRPVIWVSFAFFTIGYGLMTMLDAYSTRSVFSAFLLRNSHSASDFQFTEPRRSCIPSSGPLVLDACSRYIHLYISVSICRSPHCGTLRLCWSACKLLCQSRIWPQAQRRLASCELLAGLWVFQWDKRFIQVYVPLKPLVNLCSTLVSLDPTKEGISYQHWYAHIPSISQSKCWEFAFHSGTSDFTSIPEFRRLFTCWRTLQHGRPSYRRMPSLLAISGWSWRQSSALVL